MNRNTLRTAVLLAAAMTPAVAFSETLIDFETDPAGDTVAEGTDISTTYASLGVTFSLIGSSTGPLLAVEGDPAIALSVVSGSEVILDPAVSGVRSITDSMDFREYAADFSAPVSAVSLWMIDFGDCNALPFGSPISYSLVAYDSEGDEVDRDTFTILTYGGGSASDGNLSMVSVSGSDIWRVETEGTSQDCGTAIDDFSFALEEIETDTDGDGVDDDIDECPGTAEGAIVDGDGCSIADLCPCDADWKNHGEYVSCVSHLTNDFKSAGLISGAEKGAIVSEAGRSSCGR